MRTPIVPFGIWIAILTLAGGIAWFRMFALALVEGGSLLGMTSAVAIFVAPCSLVYFATRSWPQQPVAFCFCYSAVPLLTAGASVLAFSAAEWQGVAFWIAAAIVAFGMACVGMLLGRRAVRRSIEWRLKHGLCPTCEYPIGASDVCTECGKPVTWKVCLR